jgi:hypothetical protein
MNDMKLSLFYCPTFSVYTESIVECYECLNATTNRPVACGVQADEVLSPCNDKIIGCVESKGN